jgi:hypothetical protein
MYDYHEIILNSSDFSYGTRNRPIFQFNQEIDNSEYFQVHRVTVPFTYYVFNENRTSITVDGVTYNWVQGNYTASDWVGMMASQLPANIICTWEPITNKISFTNTSNVAFSVSFSNTQLANEELGFLPGSTNSVGTGSTHVVTAPNVANFSGPNFVYLRSPQASIFNNTEMFFSASTLSLNNSNLLSHGDILAMIPIDTNRNGVVQYTDNSAHFFQWKTYGNKRFEYYFTLGNRLEPLDFNGQPFQIRLHGFSPKDVSIYNYNIQ